MLLDDDVVADGETEAGPFASGLRGEEWIERACTSSNSRTFSIAITAWSAKVVTNSICLSVNGKGVRR